MACQKLIVNWKMNIEIKWCGNMAVWSSVCYVAHLLSVFVCCPIMWRCVLSSVLWCPLRFPHKNDVRFVFTSSCLYDGLCLIYVSCNLYLFVHSGVLHILCCVCLVFFVLCILCCQFLLIVVILYVYLLSTN
jgi:hypothetical protein